MGSSGSKTKNEKEDTKETKMNVNLPNKMQELFTGHMFIPIDVTNKVLKCVCKITVKIQEKYYFGTGFFMNIYDSKKYLLTNYHIISDENKDDNIEIEIHNHTTMNLKLENRYIKFFPQPIDITVIEIIKVDKIYNDIELLDYDSNCIKKGYEFYKNSDVFSIEYPYGKEAVNASGRIKDIDGNEFEHTIPTDNGSSGSPIMLLNSNINLVQVIGIHKEADYLKKVNLGTFIGEIFKNNGFKDDNNINIKNLSEKNDRNNKYDKKILTNTIKKKKFTSMKN